MKNRFGSGSCFGLLLGSGGGVGGPDPAFHKNLSSCTIFFFFFSSLSQIPFFRFQLKIRKLKEDFMLQKLISVRFRLALSIPLPKGSSFSNLAKTKRKKRRGREEDVSPSLPTPPFAVFPAYIYLRLPHYLNAWNRGKKERHQNYDCLIQGSRAERHFKK